MSIISSKGIEFSDAPLPEDPKLDLVPFNDLNIVAGWSNALRIKAIKEIVVYNEGELVVGIELVYLMGDNNNSPRIMHGKKTKNQTKINVAEKERIIAAFVGVHEGKIKALRFTNSHSENGTVTTGGYVATLPTGQSLEYSVAFGEISAFRGTKIRGDGGRLVTLGVQTRYLGPSENPNERDNSRRASMPNTVQSETFAMSRVQAETFTM